MTLCMIDSWLMGSFSHTQRAAITTLTTSSDSMLLLSEIGQSSASGKVQSTAISPIVSAQFLQGAQSVCVVMVQPSLIDQQGHSASAFFGY